MPRGNDPVKSRYPCSPIGTHVKQRGSGRRWQDGKGLRVSGKGGRGRTTRQGKGALPDGGPSGGGWGNVPSLRDEETPESERRKPRFAGRCFRRPKCPLGWPRPKRPPKEGGGRWVGRLRVAGATSAPPPTLQPSVIGRRPVREGSFRGPTSSGSTVQRVRHRTSEAGRGGVSTEGKRLFRARCARLSWWQGWDKDGEGTERKGTEATFLHC